MLIKPRQRAWWTAALVLALTVLAVLPILRHWPVPAPTSHGLRIASAAGYSAAALLCYMFYRVELRALGRSRAAILVFFVLLLSTLTNEIHSFDVDRATNYVPSISNDALQKEMHAHVIDLDPGILPHSYRFLPNGLVLWMQLGGVPYDAARDIYRMLAGLLLFYVIYRFARLYTNYLGGILALLLVTPVYPISFEWYIGQLTDPLSHLSFVLGFIFLQTANFPLLLATLVAGSLAKETVLALCGFYVLFCRNQNRYLLKASILCVTSVAMYLGVRLYVLHGTMQYHQVSGVDPKHIFDNWTDRVRWVPLFLLTAMAYMPFLLLGWKETPLSLKRLACYLFPVLFISSLFFSWLVETRNFMPLVIVLAVVAARYLASRLVVDDTATTTSYKTE
jgi:hypothetical protein